MKKFKSICMVLGIILLASVTAFGVPEAFEVFGGIGSVGIGSILATVPLWVTIKGEEQEFNELTEAQIKELTAEELGEYMKAKYSDMEKQLMEEVKDGKEENAMKILKLRQEMSKMNLELTKAQKAQGEFLATLNVGTGTQETVEAKVHKFIEDNLDQIQKIQKAGSGMVEIKVVGNITTGSGTYPVAAPAITGTQMAPLQPIDLREAYVLSLTTNFNTNQAAYAYTEASPKDGDYTFISEGDTKVQIDFDWKTRFAEPVEIAAWERLSNQSVQDVANLQSVATDFLRKKHDLKKQNGILFGDGISPNPKGATVYGRVFVAGSMALKVATPTIMDVINAAITDVYTTHNYVDETAYMPSLVMMNPVDFYLEFVAPKTTDGLPLFPTASLFNRVNIGGITVIPERDIPAGKIFVADMSKYNTTNYVDYTVKIGWINDDFIKNQFVILGESRFHAFVKNLDEQAFIYDDIATIRTAILKP